MGRGSKGQAIATAVIAVIIIISGILTAVLLKLYVDESTNSKQSISFNFWWIGIVYIIPGLLGILAAVTRHAAAYGVFMGFAIVALVVNAIFCILGFIALWAILIVGSYCDMQNGKCICNGTDTTLTQCDLFSGVYGYSLGGLIMLIIGWIFCLVGSIMACAACCCGRRDDGPTVVYSPSKPV